jgi:hypothetical protein
MLAVLDFCSIKPKTLELITDPDDETFALWSASPFQILYSLVAGDDEELRTKAAIVYRHCLNSERLRYLQRDTVGLRTYFSEIFLSSSVFLISVTYHFTNLNSAGMITSLSNKLLQLESDDAELDSIVSFLLDYLALRLKSLKAASEEVTTPPSILPTSARAFADVSILTGSSKDSRDII